MINKLKPGPFTKAVQDATNALSEQRQSKTQMEEGQKEANDEIARLMNDHTLNPLAASKRISELRALVDVYSGRLETAEQACQQLEVTLRRTQEEHRAAILKRADNIVAELKAEINEVLCGVHDKISRMYVATQCGALFYRTGGFMEMEKVLDAAKEFGFALSRDLSRRDKEVVAMREALNDELSTTV
ncbi:ribosome recycling factor [Variovorax boronicumulans]|uniref:hypothetical protein n=1 Tax=Variovorax boronicumulans TaxID=436515 RepID=UPI003399C120